MIGGFAVRRAARAALLLLALLLLRFPAQAELRLLGPIYVRPGPAATPAPIRYVWITYTFAF